MTTDPTRAPNWHLYAACGPLSDVDPELFFPVATSGLTYDIQVAEAKALCARCPVVSACLAAALAVPAAKDHHGIFAGTTADDRAAIRRRERDRASRAARHADPATREPAAAGV